MQQDNVDSNELDVLGQDEHVVAIYGGGIIFRKLLPEIKEKYKESRIIVIDGNPQLQNTKIDGITVFGPEIIYKLKKYTIIIATIQGYLSVREKLLKQFDVSENDIDDAFCRTKYSEIFDVRKTFLRFFANIIYERDIEGACAEGGVFEGDFAKEINECFPDKTLYLFDTFEGFDERDTMKEDGYASKRKGEFKICGVSPQTVMGKMHYPEKVKIKKGFFPETAKNIEDQFCFVNLDFDLYAPTLEGLKYFWPRMTRGGVILVHDYFSTLLFDEYAFSKVKQAVIEFSEGCGVPYLPIGDQLSVAFIKM